MSDKLILKSEVYTGHFPGFDLQEVLKKLKKYSTAFVIFNINSIVQ
jgi:hypothetical protein